MPNETDKRAEQLYRAVTATLKDTGVTGLLAVAGDAKAKVAWLETSSKTKALFSVLAANLTGIERDATLKS